MKARLETHDGKVILRVYYDPSRCNWDDAIATGLASHGLKICHVAVIAEPMPEENASSQGELFER